MEKLTKVRCANCDRKFYVEDDTIPNDVQADEAFPSECPLCEAGHYAVLAKES